MLSAGKWVACRIGTHQVDMFGRSAIGETYGRWRWQKPPVTSSRGLKFGSHVRWVQEFRHGSCALVSHELAENPQATPKVDCKSSCARAAHHGVAKAFSR